MLNLIVQAAVAQSNSMNTVQPAPHDHNSARWMGQEAELHTRQVDGKKGFSSINVQVSRCQRMRAFDTVTCIVSFSVFKEVPLIYISACAHLLEQAPPAVGGAAGGLLALGHAPLPARPLHLRHRVLHRHHLLDARLCPTRTPKLSVCMHSCCIASCWMPACAHERTQRWSGEAAEQHVVTANV